MYLHALAVLVRSAQLDLEQRKQGNYVLGMLEQQGWKCVWLPPWSKDQGEMDRAVEALGLCDAILGFEELGTDAYLEEMKKLKREHAKAGNAGQAGRAFLRPLVVWVPNLEICKPGGKCGPTLTHLDAIDVVVCKEASLAHSVQQLWRNRSVSADGLRVVVTSHCSPPPAHSPPSSLPEQQRLQEPTHLLPKEVSWWVNTEPRTRRNIIHFAGPSYLKNTLANVRAGLLLIKKHRGLFGKLLVKTTVLKNGKSLLPRRVVEELRQLAKKNQDVLELDSGGFMSDQQKAEWYNSSCLALCCSASEGFGHYIVEASAMGCLVVTTDGIPMRDVLKEPGTFSIAKSSQIRPHHAGLWHEVPADAIVQAAEELLPSLQNLQPEVICNCTRNFVHRHSAFVTEFKTNFLPVLEGATTGPPLSPPSPLSLPTLRVSGASHVGTADALRKSEKSEGGRRRHKSESSIDQRERKSHSDTFEDQPNRSGDTNGSRRIERGREKSFKTSDTERRENRHDRSRHREAGREERHGRSRRRHSRKSRSRSRGHNRSRSRRHRSESPSGRSTRKSRRSCSPDSARRAKRRHPHGRL